MTFIWKASRKYVHSCASTLWIIWRHGAHAPVGVMAPCLLRGHDNRTCTVVPESQHHDMDVAHTDDCKAIEEAECPSAVFHAPSIPNETVC